MNAKKDDEDEDILSALKGTAKEAFGIAAEEAGKVANTARAAINFGRDATDTAYNFVERTVGKERIISATIVGKIAGTAGLIGGPTVAFKAGIIGGVAGFIGGKHLVRWLDAGRANDDAPPEEKPKDPAP